MNAAASSFPSANKCPKHPKELVVGVCAVCLRERLASVDPADRHKKGLLFLDSKATHNRKQVGVQKKKQVLQSDASSSVLGGLGLLGPQLRRSKSFSEGRAQARAKIESSILEPKRKSCDIRVRNTLWALFQIDQEGEENGTIQSQNAEESGSSMELNGWINGSGPDPHSQKQDKSDERSEDPEIEIVADQVTRSSTVPHSSCSVSKAPLVLGSGPDSSRTLYDSYEIGESSSNAVRTIKFHIDQDTQNRNQDTQKRNCDNIGHPDTRNQDKKGLNQTENGLGDSKKTFWLTEMVMKRIQKWKKRNRQKHHHPQRQKAYTRDSRSEVLDDSRPSCDDDPRFSIDIGRTSWDDSRHSWEEPRASWDGILIGRLLASSSSSLVSAPHEEPATGFGSLRNHSLPSESSRHHVSDNRNNANNNKVSPDDENLKPVFPPSVEMLQDENAHNQSDDSGSLKQPTKSHKWSKAWSRTITNPMWGFIQKRNGKEEGACEGTGEGETSFSDSWREIQRERDGKRGLRKGDSLSNSSVGSRSIHCHSATSRPPNGGVINRSNSNNNAQRSKNGFHKKREEITLDRSRSVHFSPSNGDNGLLRFYLTPLRSSRRNGTGSARIRPPLSSSRNALWLY